MAIQVGDQLPQATFRVMTSDGPAPKTTDEVFKGRKVVLFAVPGAFTPTCHKNHMPGFVANFDKLKAKGVDAVVATSINDIFVLDVWAKASGANGKIEIISDGNGEFAKAIGLTFDGSGFGLGTRSQRYAMVVNDGKVEALNIEDAPGKADASSAEKLLAQL